MITLRDGVLYNVNIKDDGKTREGIIGLDFSTRNDYNWFKQFKFQCRNNFATTEEFLTFVKQHLPMDLYRIDDNEMYGQDDDVVPVRLLDIKQRGDSGDNFDFKFIETRTLGELEPDHTEYEESEASKYFTMDNIREHNLSKVVRIFNKNEKSLKIANDMIDYSKGIFSNLNIKVEQK